MVARLGVIFFSLCSSSLLLYFVNFFSKNVITQYTLITEVSTYFFKPQKPSPRGMGQEEHTQVQLERTSGNSTQCVSLAVVTEIRGFALHPFLCHPRTAPPCSTPRPTFPGTAWRGSGPLEGWCPPRAWLATTWGRPGSPPPGPACAGRAGPPPGRGWPGPPADRSGRGHA